MRRVNQRALLGVAILLAGILPASAQDDKRQLTSLAAGLYSFPEIAKGLSRPGREVGCVPSVVHRAAFISLKDRSWESIQHLFLTALSVRLRKSSEGMSERWILEPDPKTADREKAWRIRFLRSLWRELSLGAQLDPRIAGLPYAELWRRRQALKPENDRLNRASRDSKDENLKAQYHAVSREYMLYDRSTQLSPWFGRKFIQHTVGTSLPENLLNKPVWELYDMSAVFRDIPLDAQKDYLNQDVDIAKGWRGNSVACGLWFNPVSLNVGAQFNLTAFPSYSLLGGNGSPSTGGYIGIYDVVYGKDLEQGPPIGLGKVAESWLYEEHLATEAFVASKRGHEPFVFPTTMRQPSLSEVVEAWCESQHSEGVMELFPQREDLGSAIEYSDTIPKPGAQTSLFDLFHIDNGKEMFTRNWSFGECERALVVTNRLAFIDHKVALPMDGLLRVLRTMGHENNAGESSRTARHTLPLDVLEAAQPFVDQAVDAAWLYCRSMTYRGIDIFAVRKDGPFAAVWTDLYSKLSASDRVAMERGDTVEVPLTSLGQTAFSQFYKALKARVDWFPAMLRTDSRAIMERAKISIRARASDSAPGTYTVSARIFPASPDGLSAWTPFVIDRVRLAH